jgi:glycerol-3-phosphate acyltransferase PlsY
MSVVLIAAASYLLGSLPSGYLIFRISEKKDIRRFGSHATGATNVLRLKGWRYALPVAVIDLAKGFVPAYIVLKVWADPNLAAVSAAFAVIGHCFPVYIGFRGGKGVATAAGAMFAIAPLAALFSLVVFVLIVLGTRYVSLGSILAAAVFPVFLAASKKSLDLILLSSPILLVILLRHAPNIRRLIRGQERKFGQKESHEP